ncbi:hypothetical protein FZEAL_2484 [Fusarium zealandicum]|uniref:Uncharacterized protein n=1 Tax=Fusarium zealandicum TaxID=1053134 RepID=A0A8H4UQQ6_9HYPO|nr:hypothetical protein FZEAL_2484 [Fusarium zealandicum]
MRSSAVTLFLGWAVKDALAEAVTITKSCNTVWGITDCSGRLTFPTYSEPDFCGTATQCGIKINTEDRDVCEVVNEVMGDTSFVNNADVYCGCLPESAYYSESSFWKPMYNGFLGGSSTPNSINQLYRNERCVIDGDLTIKSDRAAVIQKDLANKDGWTVLRAPEYDLSMYRRLAEALAPCDESTCDAAKLRAFFSSYIGNAEGITDGELVRLLNSWLPLIESLKRRLTDINSASRIVQARLKSVSSKISQVKSKVCRGNACKATASANYLKKISTMLSATKNLQGISAAADRGLKNIPRMQQLTRAGLTYTTTAADGTYYVGLVDNYQLTTVRDAIKAFRVTDYFPRAVDDLRKAIAPCNDITGTTTRGRVVQTQINGVLAYNWSRSKTPARQVRDGFTSMQRTINSDLRVPVNNLIKSTQALHDLLDKFAFRKRKLEWKYGAASYQRWIDLAIKAPCEDPKTRTYVSNTFSEEYSWTAIKVCDLDPTKVIFPKYHIPYIKYRWVF